MATKRCSSCKEEFAATRDFFYGNRTRSDGLATECRDCMKASARVRYQADPVSYNERRKPYWKARYEAQRELRIIEPVHDPVNDLTDLDLAYLAGLLDGEGSFIILETVRGMFLPSINLAMTHAGVVEWVSQQLSITTRYTQAKGGRCKPIYIARISGQRAVRLAVRLGPWLKVKDRQADVLRRFGETYSSDRRQRPHITPETRESRVALMTEIRDLNASSWHQRERERRRRLSPTLDKSPPSSEVEAG